MPRKRKGADLSRNTSRSRSVRDKRSQRTGEQVQQQNADARESIQQLCQEQSENTRAERNKVIRLEQRQSRRFTVNRRRTNDQQRYQVHRAFTSDSFLHISFQYESDIEYYAHSKVVVGAMDKECPHCHALNSKMSYLGCVAIKTPPEPLNGLLTIGTDPDSNQAESKTACRATSRVADPVHLQQYYKFDGQQYHFDRGINFNFLAKLSPNIVTTI
ncbi:unnamed protein product [Diabrotica balteata]|uniref:Uncharacterized protein n=1 Tax=Diabrotica balteata TaxID=107213 RepID=A0A9P0DTT9_DIABA|nr:unnamed protein product [Diabrotica balteata]